MVPLRKPLLREPSQEDLTYVEAYPTAKAHRYVGYTDGLSFDQFQATELVLDAMVFNLRIAGEAARQRLSPVSSALMTSSITAQHRFSRFQDTESDVFEVSLWG
jgi:hypothetical protein